MTARVVVSNRALVKDLLSRRLLLAATVALPTIQAVAAPSGGQVAAGDGSIVQNGSTTTINQNTQNLSLTWQAFDIAPSETVNFVQPNALAVAINRILGNNGTEIQGRLNANGQVWLINPNGILFGHNAQVNVGGIVASTLDLGSNADGVQRFSGAGTGSVINEGTITATDGGYVALIGNSVSNQGNINAVQGTVGVAAGSTVTLTFADNQLVQLQVERSVLDSLAANGGLIQADGGTVMLTAGAKDSVLASVVNNTGVIEAHSMENHNGTITLLAGGNTGTVNVGGTLDASAPASGDGGAIETSALHVKISDNAKITTAASNGFAGTWLIDPVDFTIAATGGDISGASLNTSLASGNVTIQSITGGTGTSGDINVNDSVTWSTNTLTLDASNNINFNSALNASGTAGLSLLYGQGAVASGNTSSLNINAPINLAATGSFATRQGSDGVLTSHTILDILGSAGSTTGTDLQGIRGNLSGNYVLGANIDASSTSTWNAGAGFTPIGTSGSKFTGTFNGLGHTISDLSINRPGTFGVGLFGYAFGVISDVGMVGGTVTGNDLVGLLVGNNNGIVKNAYATGNVIASLGDAGGLVGANFSGASISNSYATGSVTGSSQDVGGLLGWNSSSTVTNSYATGNVSGTDLIGGLVGGNVGTGAVNNSYATGTVTATAGDAGGLIGWNNTSGAVTNSYATGNVSSNGGGAGGLVGDNFAGSITNAYATGNVSGTNANAGGLVGTNSAGGTVTNTYATGAVSGSFFVGALIGSKAGTVTNSFYNNEVTTSQAGFGNAADAAGTVWGMTSAQMQVKTNFTTASVANNNTNPSWDLATTPVWGYSPTLNDQHPILCFFGGCVLINAYVNPVVGSSIYGTTPNISYALVDASGNALTLTNASVTGTAAYNGAPNSTSSVGQYTNSYASGLNISGAAVSSYELNSYSVSAPNWTVNPATLSVANAAAGNKVYDGNTSAVVSGATLTGVVGSDAVSLSNATSGTFASANVANGINVSTSMGLSGAQASNYVLAAQPSLTADITPATLTYNATPASVLSGQNPSGLTGTITGFVNGEVLADTTTGSPLWTTTATYRSEAGQYPINGSGLNAGNYAFAQAIGNATALTLTSSARMKIAIAQIKSTTSGLSGAANGIYVGSPASVPGASTTVVPDGAVESDTKSTETSNGKNSEIDTENGNGGRGAKNGGDVSEKMGETTTLMTVDGGVKTPESENASKKTSTK